MEINFNGKKFKPLSNTTNGEVSDQTLFEYKQEGEMIWAEYKGGGVVKGLLIGKIIDDHLEFTYQHLNNHLELMTGECKSYPSLLESGKIKIKEEWKWTCKDFSHGESVLIEVYYEL